MNMRKVLLIVGITVFGVGLLVGLIPVSSSGVNCGSAFVESHDAYVSDLVGTMPGEFGTTGVADDCQSLRSMLRIPAIVFLLIGLVVGLASLYVSTPRANASSKSDA